MINAFDKWGLAPGNRTRSIRTNEIAQTPLEVSIEGSRTLISHLPSALIINHQSVLNSHPTRQWQVCIRLSLAKEGLGVVRSTSEQIYSEVDRTTPSAPSKVASRFLIDGAATPPLPRRGIIPSFPSPPQIG